MTGRVRAACRIRPHAWRLTMSLVMSLGSVVAVSPPAWGQAGQAPGRMMGIVVDQRTGEGLPSAVLQVVGTEIRGPAAADGRFILPPMDPGPVTIEVTHPGYEARTETIEVLEGQLVDVRLALVADTTFQLDPLTVTVRSLVLERRGFYQRRQQGYAGAFFSREDIVERDARTFTELLEGLPGVRVLPAGIEGARVVFQRGVSLRDSGVCAPVLYLDGVRSQIRVYDSILSPAHIEGVEVYTGANVPGRFNDPCGAILIWTRVP